MLSRIRGWISTLRAKAGVVATAWPTYAAAATAVLTTASLEVVPRLPGPWQLQTAGYVASGLAAIAAVSAVVARVTPVLFPENRGLLAPPPNQSYTTPDGSVRNFASPGGTTRVVTQ